MVKVRAITGSAGFPGARVQPSGLCRPLRQLVLLTALPSVAIAGFSAAAHAQTAAATPEPLPAGSDYLCQTDVHYNWRPHPPKKKGGESAGTSGSPADGAEEEPVRKEFALSGTEQGLIQALVEARLKARIPTLQSQAMAACKAAHEGEAGCIASHLEKHQRQYAEMDYSSRRALLDAIAADCRATSGNCVGAEAGPIQCAQNKPPELAEPPPKAEAEKGAKGDAKKK